MTEEADQDESKVGYADFGVGMFIINPFKEIRDAKERKDWPAGFATSATYFKYWGAVKLEAYFKFHKLATDDKTHELKTTFKDFIKRLEVRDIITLLYSFDIIDETTHKQMKEINVERNNMEHVERKGVMYRYQDEERFRKLLDHAITCIDTLSKVRFD